ncbi:hypothetical protein F5884DRAFT_725552 [Xylogone sp. PMI_703]|nr:hypothetical protein F5884DRAFT_725552 [Xylogone sp. PMI_703]
MDGRSSKQGSGQPPIVDQILQIGKLAFDPAVPEETRGINKDKFHELLRNTGTVTLLPAMNLLVQPDRVQPWFRSELIRELALLPLRPLGVQHTIEFILSVHPSNANFSAPVKAGRGSGISHEALNAASRLLSSPPAGMSPEDWFSSLAPQLLFLLDGKGEPEMDRAAAFIIGFGILGRRQYGAPAIGTGMPGWNAFAGPLLRSIDPPIAQKAIGTKSGNHSEDPEDILTIGRSSLIVGSPNLAQALSRLEKLVSFHPNPSLSQRLLRPIMLPLWCLGYWETTNEITAQTYCKPARKLLRNLLLLASSKGTQSGATPSNNILIIAKNLLFNGRQDPDHGGWIYIGDKGQPGGICIEKRFDTKLPVYEDLVKIDKAVTSFTQLLKSVPELDEISNLFLHLYKKWLSYEIRPQTPSIIMPFDQTNEEGFMERIIDAKIMQQMIIDFPDKLVQDSKQVLEIISQSLTNFNDLKERLSENEESITVSLSLLNIILTSPSFKSTEDVKSLLDMIEKSLESISKSKELDASSTAQNLLLLLKFRDTIDEGQPRPAITPTEKDLESRKTYNLAMSYLTSTESPPPVRVQGLELLSGLIRDSSPVLDIPALLVLFSTLLQDDEEYIYLRAIQSFNQLAVKHPRTVIKDLIERYVDSQEELELDSRLRLGETLVQVIRSSASSLTGDLARTVCEGLLSMSGRRSYRPKTQLEQEKKQKLKEKQNKEAEEAWGGEVPQLDEVLPEEFSQEQNEILAQIVAGWEGKRGTEDVRIRTSAVAILGVAIEANITGIGSRMIAAAVDVCIHILTLELAPEFGILRRSAVLLIMSLIRSLDAAREAGKSVGFGFVGESLDDITRILTYISETDNDGLVRQHAKDVIEGLRTLQMSTLISHSRPRTGIEKLAGLSINPEPRQKDAPRPRIEEIE